MDLPFSCKILRVNCQKFRPFLCVNSKKKIGPFSDVNCQNFGPFLCVNSKNFGPFFRCTFFSLIVKILDLFTRKFSKFWTFFSDVKFFSLIVKILDLHLRVNSPKILDLFSDVKLFSYIVKILDPFYT